MRLFRNVAFIVLLVVGLPVALEADGYELCEQYCDNEDGCGCDAYANYYLLHVWDEEDCGGYPQFCQDAWVECLDMCYDYASSQQEPGPWWPQYFDCVDDYECVAECLCPPIE